MTTVAGLAPGERGTAALHRGAMVARSSSDDLILRSSSVPVTLVPRSAGLSHVP